MNKWSEYAGGSKLPNQCFSMKLGKFKLRFETEDEANEFLESTNQLAHQESYECNACSGWHLTSKNRGRLRGPDEPRCTAFHQWGRFSGIGCQKALGHGSDHEDRFGNTWAKEEQ